LEEPQSTLEELKSIAVVCGEPFAMTDSTQTLQMLFADSWDSLQELNPSSLKDTELVKFGLMTSIVLELSLKSTSVAQMAGESTTANTARMLVSLAVLLLNQVWFDWLEDQHQTLDVLRFCTTTFGELFAMTDSP
jgi:hypothetical protein